MKRLLTAGIFGTILGIVGTGTANASIVSSGFLDEKLTEYALSTSLDLKANQTDLTALSNKIGNDWPFYGEMLSGLHDLIFEFYSPEINLENTSDLAHFLFGGALESGLYENAPGVLSSLAQKIINVGDYDFLSNKVQDGFRSLTQLTNGWTDKTDGTTYLGIKDLNTKIGTLPTETAMSSCSVWRAIDLTQNEMPNTIGGILDQLYNSGHTNGSCQHDGYNGPSLPNIIRKLIYGYNYDQGTTRMMGINLLNMGERDEKGNFIRPGLNQITNGWTGTDGTTYLGVKDINTKIGDLPSGALLWTDSLNDFLIAALGTKTPEYPASMAEMIKQIYGVEGEQRGLIYLLRVDLNSVMRTADFAGSKATTAQTTANNAIEKIGTLPDGYDSVGAALTAIKGIAEDAKAAALAAIPDPKQEGSSGKFVLTVDIVGDNATYRWEKIDREGETTTTTE